MGSPNIKGNSAKLVNAILDGAAENGADIVVYNLASLEIKGCDACRRCQDSGCCLIEDDMQEIYREIQTAGVVVLGSPVYMWQMTAQTKLFIDRLTPFLKPNFSSRLDNKKLILVFSQGSSDTDAFKPYFEYTAGLLYYMGFDVLDTIIAAGTDILEVSSRPKLLEKARDLGKLISASNRLRPQCTRLESSLTQSLWVYSFPSLVPESAYVAGYYGDGLLAVGEGENLDKAKQILSQFEKGAKDTGKDTEEMPKAIELFIDYGVDPGASIENFMKFWAGAVIPALFVNKIYTPEMSAQNGKVVGPETVRKHGCFSENPEAHIKFVKKYIDAGFTHIYVHWAASDQISFLKAYGKDVLPALKET